MALKIYTKTGDKGLTSLIQGTRVPKSDPRIEAYGTVDELNSWIGLVADQVTVETCRNVLLETQDRLLTIGALLATDPNKKMVMKLPQLAEADVTLLETEIDKMSNELPPLKAFILPGGHVTVSNIHIARCVCRRAERHCVLMQQNEIPVDLLIIKYLNRLSDYLFELARYMSHKLGAKEIPWKARV
jgi:cob(I)alamin adenosyltransferase